MTSRTLEMLSRPGGKPVPLKRSPIQRHIDERRAFFGGTRKIYAESSTVPVPYPQKFRRDVIAVARQGERSRAQVARSFGISESCLNRWTKIADRQDGGDQGGDASPGTGRNRTIAWYHGMKRLRIHWERREAFLSLATRIITYRHIVRLC